MIGSACPAIAQEHLTFQGDFLFYGDNTEFRNAFREGETLLGTAVRAAAVFDVNDRVRVSLGAFGNVRFGGDDAFELARPIVSLTVVGRRSSFVFGTLPPPRVGDPPGPDRTGPHGLLPPLERETLAFDRPYEAGLAWKFAGEVLRHEVWIDWQRVNTKDHRERFDAGAAGEVKVSRVAAIPFRAAHRPRRRPVVRGGSRRGQRRDRLRVGAPGPCRSGRTGGDRSVWPRVEVRSRSRRPV